MPRYIDGDKIISHLNDEIEACGDLDVDFQPVTYGTYLGLKPSKSFVETAETADVVQVVLCKDCKHTTFYSCKNDTCYKGIICEYQIAIGDENFFCACGEARTPKERDMEK